MTLRHVAGRSIGSAELRMLVLLASSCGLLIAAGVAIPILSGASATPSALVLGDVSEAHIVEIRNQRGEAVVSGEFRSRIDALGNIEKDAALIDRRGRTVIGEVELEVDVIGLPGRETFAVVIDDRTVGTFTTDDRGSIDMELQEGEVPAPAPTAGT